MARKNVKFVRKPGDTCSNCGTVGHWANTCAKPKKGTRGNRSRNYYKRY